MVITKTLDVKLAGSQWITEAVKGEANARTLHIAFEEEGHSLSLENVAHAYLYARKPSGQYSLINSCTINADNTIDYVETAQTCAEQGIMLCTLVLVDEDGATLYSPQFTIHIFPNEMDQSGIVSASEFTAINEQVASADDSRKRAEAWAVGTMDGEPVPSDDETYENNSKYYAEQAEQIKNETQDIADDVDDVRDDVLLIKEQAQEIVDDAVEKVIDMTATAHQISVNAQPTVSKTGGDETPINLDFGMPAPNGIVSIRKTQTSGLNDIYKITFTNNNTFEYVVKNGKDGVDGQDGQDGEGLPAVTSADNGKIAQVVNGEWTAADLDAGVSVAGKKFRGRADIDMPSPRTITVNEYASFKNGGAEKKIESITIASTTISYLDGNGNTIQVATLDSGLQWVDDNNGRVIWFDTNAPKMTDADYAVFIQAYEEISQESAITEDPNFTAGTALAVIDKSSYTPSTSPYLYRQSPSGKRCEYDVIGGTVGWNQQHKKVSEETFIPSGNSNTTYTKNGEVLHISVNGDNTAKYSAVSVTRITSLIRSGLGHKFLMGFKLIATSGYDAFVAFNTGGRIYGGTPNNYYYTIAEAANNSIMQIGSNPNVVMTTSDYVDVTDIMLIDLTTLLGSTIADYAYSLEQATAGSGIAWLKSFGFLTKSYYPYTEPTLESVQATARVADGFNLFDRSKATENVGLAWATGSTFNEQGSIVTDYIRALDATYYTNFRGAVFGYDSDKNYIGAWSNSGWVKSAGLENTSRTIQGAYYIRFAFRKTSNSNTDMTTENISVSLNVEAGSGTYYPYDSHTYPLGNTTLRGIPKLDSNNNIYYDGDKYKASGEITRRYGVVDLGTLTWSNPSSNYSYTFNLPDRKAGSGLSNRIFFAPSQFTNFTFNSDNLALLARFESGTFSTGNEVKTALTGVYLVYELATPTTETTDSFTPIQYTGSTESFTTENDVPVGVDAKYYDEPFYTKEESNDALAEQVGLLLRQMLATTKNINFNNTAVVDMGELTYNLAQNYFYTSGLASLAKVNGSCLCLRYNSNSKQFSPVTNDKACFINSSNANVIVVDSSFSDATALKESLQGILLAYEKA